MTSIEKKASDVINIIKQLIIDLTNIAEIHYKDKDNFSASDRIERWKARTVKFISENISEVEGVKLANISKFSHLHGERARFIDGECNKYSRFLNVLVEELITNPSDAIQLSQFPPRSVIKQPIEFKNMKGVSKDRKYQIFISSTYEDLKDTRKAIQDEILRMEHFPVGMELFSASGKPPWDIIKKTIDCSDYYLLIIGLRYGSETDDGISYTQKEFEYAKSKEIPILAFIRNENVSSKPNERDSDPQKQKKLEEFRESVSKNTERSIEWWDSENNLVNKIGRALSKAFNNSPRPGWKRVDHMIIENTQKLNDVTNMSQIRKLIYNILSQIEKGEKTPTWKDDGIDKEFYAATIDMMENDGLIKGANVIKGGIGSKVNAIFLKNAQITLKGVKYLEENNALAKTIKD